MSNPNDLLAKIESRQLWSYFHKEWLIEIRSQIRRQLPATHYVFIESESTLISPAPAEVEARSMPDEIFSQYSLIIGRWRENRIVAALEMLSPLNKGLSSRFDREKYLRKRDCYLESCVNLLEIDALTTGESVAPKSISKAVASDRHVWTCFHDAGVPRVEACGWNSDQAMPIFPWHVESGNTVTVDLGVAAVVAIEFNRWHSLIEKT